MLLGPYIRRVNEHPPKPTDLYDRSTPIRRQQVLDMEYRTGASPKQEPTGEGIFGRNDTGDDFAAKHEFLSDTLAQCARDTAA